MASQEDLRAAFALYDTNGDGLLSPDELKAIMCRQVPGGTARTEAEVDELVRQFDTDGDGMLSMEELSKAWMQLDLRTSKWDAPALDASVLKRALPDTKLVDAAYFVDLAEQGKIVPRCQDVPPDAVVTLAEMEAWDDPHSVAVLVLSYPWLDSDHPDALGEQIQRMAVVFRAFANEAKDCSRRVGRKCRVGVYME